MDSLGPFLGKTFFWFAHKVHMQFHKFGANKRDKLCGWKSKHIFVSMRYKYQAPEKVHRTIHILALPDDSWTKNNWVSFCGLQFYFKELLSSKVGSQIKVNSLKWRISPKPEIFSKKGRKVSKIVFSIYGEFLQKERTNFAKVLRALSFLSEYRKSKLS